MNYDHDAAEELAEMLQAAADAITNVVWELIICGAPIDVEKSRTWHTAMRNCAETSRKIHIMNNQLNEEKKS